MPRRAQAEQTSADLAPYTPPWRKSDEGYEVERDGDKVVIDATKLDELRNRGRDARKAGDE